MPLPPRAADQPDDNIPNVTDDSGAVEHGFDSVPTIDEELMEFSGDLDELIKAQAEKIRAERRAREAEEKKAREESALSEAQTALRNFVKSQAVALADELDRIEGVGGNVSPAPAAAQDAVVSETPADTEATGTSSSESEGADKPEPEGDIKADAVKLLEERHVFDTAFELKRLYPAASEKEIAEALTHAQQQLNWVATLRKDGLSDEAVRAAAQAFGRTELPQDLEDESEEPEESDSEDSDDRLTTALMWAGVGAAIAAFFGILGGFKVFVILLLIAIGAAVYRFRSKADDEPTTLDQLQRWWKDHRSALGWGAGAGIFAGVLAFFFAFWLTTTLDGPVNNEGFIRVVAALCFIVALVVMKLVYERSRAGE